MASECMTRVSSKIDNWLDAKIQPIQLSLNYFVELAAFRCNFHLCMFMNFLECPNISLQLDPAHNGKA